MSAPYTPRGGDGFAYGHDDAAFSADIQRALNVVLFAFRAVRRRIRIAILVFLVTLLAAGAALAVMPKMYRVTTRILTHRAYVLPALVSPRRSIPLAADTPTKGAVEMLKSRKLLDAVIEHARLKDTWDETRPPIGQLKDRVREAILGPLSDEDFHEALLEMLDKRIIAYVDEDVVVTQVEWHHPEVTFAISEAVQEVFLRNKKDGELSEVRETLHILQDNVDSAHRTMEAAAEEFQRVVKSKTGQGSPSVSSPVKMRTIRVRKPGDDEREDAPDPRKIAQLERDLADVRHVLRGEEERYQTRLDQANAALSGLRQTLGPEHPDVQNAIRAVEERSRVPSELLRLRAQEAELVRQLRRIEDKLVGKRSTGAYETVEVPDDAVSDTGGRLEMTDPDIERALSSLEQRIARYNEFVLRLEDARTELATADAAFDHRYFVTMPPLFPKKHVKPKVPMVLGGGFFAALMLAFAFALGVDLASRRVLEPWQIERLTGVAVLGSVTVKRPLLHDGEALPPKKDQKDT